MQSAAEPAANADQTSADAPAEGSIEVVEDWATNEQDGGGEEIVLSAPEEEASEDQQLREIYSRETHVNIAAVLRYVDGEKPRGPPHIVSEEAYRACHTLSGSSRMAEARHGIRLTAPLEHWVRKSFDSGVGLEAAGSGTARGMHERHAIGRLTSRRIDRFLPVAHAHCWRVSTRPRKNSNNESSTPRARPKPLPHSPR